MCQVGVGDKGIEFVVVLVDMQLGYVLVVVVGVVDLEDDEWCFFYCVVWVLEEVQCVVLGLDVVRCVL